MVAKLVDAIVCLCARCLTGRRGSGWSVFSGRVRIPPTVPCVWQRVPALGKGLRHGTDLSLLLAPSLQHHQRQTTLALYPQNPQSAVDATFGVMARLAERTYFQRLERLLESNRTSDVTPVAAKLK